MTKNISARVAVAGVGLGALLAVGANAIVPSAGASTGGAHVRSGGAYTDVAVSLDEIREQLSSARYRARKTALADAVILPTEGLFTSGFGSRWGAHHAGVDIAAVIGTPVRAVRTGTVKKAGPADGYGQWIVLQHDDGAESVYGHIETVDVEIGQEVLAGDRIATVGNRGFSTGPHLHFEYHIDQLPIDPFEWLRTHGVDLLDLLG